jgi:hypothetical protein
MNAITVRTDALTKEEALDILKKNRPFKQKRGNNKEFFSLLDSRKN